MKRVDAFGWIGTGLRSLTVGGALCWVTLTELPAVEPPGPPTYEQLVSFGNLIWQSGVSYSGLVQGTDGALYGTEAFGDNGTGYNIGTVYKLNPDGTGFTTVFQDFDYDNTGAYVNAGLVQGTDGALYGATVLGGSGGGGTLFRVNPDGTGFTVLKSFDGLADGGELYAAPIQGTDGALYGTTGSGGNGFGYLGDGVVYKLNPDGTGFTILRNLNDSTDGRNPYAGLMQGIDGALYGTAVEGGSNGFGTVYKLNPDGTGFTVLKHFAGSTDGASPLAGLMQGSDGALYGTASGGGSGGSGTLYKLNPDGAGFTVLRHLDGSTDGGSPIGGLMRGSDGALYGTASGGGSSGHGTVYGLNPDGTGFTVLKDFDGSPDGAFPFAGLFQAADGNLYGTTAGGGEADAGVVFRLVFPGPADLCAGTNPVVCTALDPCHDVGTCNPETGECSNPVKADGSSCSDGDACTQTDSCQAGACTGSNSVVCTASDPCHDAGVCNPGNGVCSNPAKADGSACSDGSACTQTDTCVAGTCTGGNYSWSGVLQPINADGSSVFKLGSTIPTKFRLTGACAGDPGLVANIYFYKVTNSEGPINEATSVSAADTGTVFRYSASGDQYIYNLGTKGLTEGTWQLGIDLHDDVGIRVVSVGLRK